MTTERRADLLARLPSVQAIKEGWIYRSSGWIETVVNKRYAAIAETFLMTYQRKGDARPTKVWSLSGAVIGSIKETDCEIKAKGTSTVVAVVASRCKRQTLHGFKIRFANAEPLTIYLESPEEATVWHSKFLAVAGTPAPSIAASSIAPGEQTGPSPEQAAPSRAPSVPSFKRPRVPKRVQRRKWSTLKHVNGVAVYMEEAGDDGTGGAIMASLVVRAAPRDVFTACITEFSSAEAGGGDVTNDRLYEELERVSEHRTIIKGHVRAAGWLRWLCARREYVVSETWRVDDEGTYVLLYQSVEHPDAPRRPRSLFDWTTPVRLQLPAAGLTIAPLQPRFHAIGESPESLFTLVMKTEAGGWLEGSMASVFLGRQQLSLTFVEPFILTMIAVRDRLEQERFVIQPLEFGEEEDAVTTLDVLDHNFRSKSLLQARMLQSVMEGEDAASSTTDGVAASTGARAWREGTCDPKYWSCPGAAGFRVRGPKYLADKKKVEAAPPVFALVATELIRTQRKSLNVAELLPSVKVEFPHQPEITGSFSNRLGDAPFALVVNLMIPGPPFLSLVFVWGAEIDPESMPADTDSHSVAASVVGDSDEDELSLLSPVDRALARFVAGTDADRTNYFKLIPKVVQGSWIVKQAVGTTPVILGRKLTTTYHKGALEGGRRYLEIDVDIGSSSAASSVVGLVQPATKSLVVDLAVLLEGTRQDELPEGLLGTVRMAQLDLATYKYLDMDSGEVYTQGNAPMEVQAWK